jgi:hypothetical protein
VLRVVYLIFNEGYSPTSGEAVTRQRLSAEAIRLGRLLVQLLPDPEVVGLLALMVLHETRRTARTSPRGDIVLLNEQDRSAWDRELIEEGSFLVEQALASRRIGPYALQARFRRYTRSPPMPRPPSCSFVSANGPFDVIGLPFSHPTVTAAVLGSSFPVVFVEAAQQQELHDLTSFPSSRQRGSLRGRILLHQVVSECGNPCAQRWRPHYLNGATKAKHFSRKSIIPFNRYRCAS